VIVAEKPRLGGGGSSVSARTAPVGVGIEFLTPVLSNAQQTVAVLATPVAKASRPARNSSFHEPFSAYQASVI
jgi:hypothetical protein